MKFHVKTGDFQKAISAVEGVITVREIKSVLSNLKLEAEENRVSISATDLEISIKTSIASNTHVVGSGSIPAKQLSNILKAINFSETSLENVNEGENSAKTIITDAENKVDFKMMINGIGGEEIKTISTIDDSRTSGFQCNTLSSMIKKTSFSVALEDTRFVFNGLYVKSFENKIVVVGTDGRRLARVEREFTNNLPFQNGVIIPHKAIKEILKIIDHNESGRIGLIDNQIYIKINEIELLCKLIDGNYPDYEAVIPKETHNNIKMPKDKFLVALRQALIAAEEPSRQLRLRFNDNNLHINASTPGTTEANINIPVDYSGEDTTIAFKGDFLLDIVKSIEDQEIIIEFNNSNAPVVFKDPSDPQYISVVMPMKL